MAAQTPTTGSVSGVVRDELGQPLRDARVVLSEPLTGFERAVETGRDGRFEFNLLFPGSYDVLAERLWSQPVLVRGIPVRTARVYQVPIRLAAATPPVETVAVVDYDAGLFIRQRPELSRAGAAWWFSALELDRLPDATRQITELGRFSSSSSAALETEGLPSGLSGIVIDGVPFMPALHPDLAVPTQPSAVFPRSMVGQAELLTNGLDVEWSEFPGGILSGYTRRGTKSITARLYGDWSGQGVVQSDDFNPDGMGHTMLRGGFMISGPVRRDTTEFVIGGEVRRVETPIPSPWASTGLDSALVATASDSFAVDLGQYVGSQRRDIDIGSVFGRFDGRFSDGVSVNVRGSAGIFKARNPDLGAPYTPGIGSTVEGNDISGAVTITGTLGASSGVEIRTGVEISSRDFVAGSLPGTAFLPAPIAFGADPTLPGQFERIGFRGSGALHFRLGQHRMKFGSWGKVASFDHTYDHGRLGVFLFGGVDEFARREGVFVQSVGALPVARFGSSSVGGFFQDVWTIAPGVILSGGIRVEGESLPQDDVRLNEEWMELTGLRTTDLPSSILKVSPRVALTIGNPRIWQAHAEFGMYDGEASPGVLAEAVRRTGPTEVRRGVGPLGRWPGTPDSVAAPVMGPALAMLGPEYQSPRTTRASLGITGSLHRNMRYSLAAVYRHTDFLPRRADLNLVASPLRQDQHDRPIYGTLEQQGELLAATPGSNRRFSGFDLVSAINPDGWSDYWGVTLRVERRMTGWLSGTVSYTYSSTKDNWLSGNGGGPSGQLNPFPHGLGGHDWAEGRSDFDVPHRVVAGVDLDLGPIRIAGFYRFRSGIPFTPGFRNGVDANGDGSFNNDPAYVDDRIAGVSDLFGTWDCLRGQVGRFAARNACRGSGAHTLDVRLTAPFRLAGYPFQVTIDGLNIFDAGLPVLDRALYHVDRNGTLQIDPVSGRVRVPLTVNPEFGRPIIRRTTGRRLRVGMRVGYE